MDYDVKINNDRISARVSAVVYNSDLTKILIFKGKDKDYYLLPGGRIMLNEDSKNAVAREIKEELGWQLTFDFLAIEEIFLKHNDINNHQYGFVYKAIYKGIIENSFYGKEDDYQVFEWINISELENYNIKPEEIKEIIQKGVTHIIIKE